MAYGDPGQSFSDVMAARKVAKEEGFFGNLLQYGMSAGGQFDIVDGEAIYTGGTEMPDKTALWNSYLSMKGNRITAADVQRFEANYTQASAMRTQKQMAELGKLKMRGMSDSKIRGTIENSPVLYKSLMDLTSNLESSGDENAFAQAQMLRTYLPDMSPSLLEGLAEEPGLMGRIGAPLALAGTVAGGQYLAATPGESAKARSARASELVKTRAEKNSLKRKISNAEKFIKKRPDSQKAKDILSTSKERLQVVNKDLKDLKPLSKGEARYKTLAKKIPKGGGLPASILGYGALQQTGALGKALGGETGESIGEDIGSLGLLGWGAMGLKGLRAAPHPYMKAIGYTPLAVQGIAQLINKYR